MRSPDDEGGLLKGAKWVPEVHLGHVIQAATYLLTTLVAVGGIYFGIIVHLADLDRKIAVQDQRVTAVEVSVARVDDAEKALAASVGAKLDNITASLADLRVLVAGLPRDPAHH